VKRPWSTRSADSLMREAEDLVVEYDALMADMKMFIPTITHPLLTKAGLLMQAALIQTLRRGEKQP
jgi:hypothetical protein